MDAGMCRRLDRGAKRLGANRSALARLGILRVLEEIEAGRIEVPMMPAEGTTK